MKAKVEEEFKTLVHVEGQALKIENKEGVFQEIIIQDALSSIIIPVITFEPISSSVGTALMCVGTIHYNWVPDMRCEEVKYPAAIKAITIKQR